MPKVTEQYLVDRRRHILEAARRCFLRNGGFQATSMQDIFTESGLSSGAVYRYFPSKDEMILAIAEDNIREVIGMIRTVADEHSGGAVGAALAAATDLVDTKTEHEGLTELSVQVWAEALRNPHLGPQYRRMLMQTRAEVTDIVRDHQDAGHLPPNVPATALADVLISILPGYILQLALLGPNTIPGIADALRALWPHPGSDEAQTVPGGLAMRLPASDSGMT
ncbi:TetR/AcrR family transcriptional regulator [Streptomyces sp. NPDC005065]|uniref:TetR/AcrR family transcriptional regulator n=1 Tax=Streptomyces sp. NPDC005065 TaxID=3154461 RepID=UPI0033B2428B